MFWIFLLALISTTVCAYPENIRYGYFGCKSCHVSHVGGDALNSYGRMTRGEMLTALSLINAEEKPTTIDYSAKLKHIATFNNENKQDEHFVMQSEASLAVNFSDFTLNVSGGLYGREHEPDTLQHWISWNPMDEIGIRVGRFPVAFGLMTNDHTLIHRQHLGFGPLQASYNGELVLGNKFGQIIITKIFGSVDTYSYIDEYGLTVHAEGKEGTSLRMSAFLGKSYELGLSQMITDTQTNNHTEVNGVFARLAPLPWLYTLVETYRQEINYTERELLTYAKVGIEPIKGLHLFYEFERANTRYIDNIKHQGGFQIFLFDNLMFLFKGSRERMMLLSSVSL